MSIHTVGDNAEVRVSAPDLSKWTSDEARARFAKKVDGYIRNEVDIRCKSIEGIMGLFNTTGFEFDDTYYNSVREKFRELFQSQIDASLADDGVDYIDITVSGDSWENCEVSGGLLSQADDIESKYEAKKTLVFRFEK